MAMVRDKIRGAPSQFTVETHRLPFATNAERLFYRGVQGALKKQLQMLYEGRLKGNTEMMFLVLLLRLRQISVHLQVYVDSLKQRAAAAKKPCPVKDYTGSSTKIEKLVGLLTEAAAADERRDWVVFCQFREEINLVEERLKKESGLVSRIFRYDGSMSMEARQEQINASKQVLPEDAGKQKVFLVQIKAGGAGLNLQHFHNVVFMSPWWNAAQMDQAIGRVQRIGQAQKVGVHYLILEEEEEQSRNIDRYMYKKVAQKKEICEVFLQSSSHFLTRQDMAAQDGDAEAEDVAEDNVAFYEQFDQIDMDYDMFEDDEEVGADPVGQSSGVSDSDSEDPK
jgi:superfamily II DNA/RNA helicase